MLSINGLKIINNIADFFSVGEDSCGRSLAQQDGMNDRCDIDVEMHQMNVITRWK